MNTIRNPGLRWTLTGLACAALLAPGVIAAGVGNIDAVEKYTWSESAGWVNFRPTDGGVTVHATHLSGFAWAENVGWIKLGADAGGPYGNSNATNWGVNRDAFDDLSGYAWSESAGWINFDPAHGQVTIDGLTGEFDGFAWSENLGWIHFRNDAIPYGVKQLTIAVPTVAQWGLIALGLLLLAGLAVKIRPRGFAARCVPPPS